jgi:hypothetical protein
VEVEPQQKIGDTPFIRQITADEGHPGITRQALNVVELKTLWSDHEQIDFNKWRVEFQHTNRSLRLWLLW